MPAPPQSSQPEIIPVPDNTDEVSCDGGGGALGHPKVWYTLEEGVAECGYCDRLFVRESMAADLRRRRSA